MTRSDINGVIQKYPVWAEIGRIVVVMATVLGILWTVAKPHAQGLVEESVKDRFETIEKSIEDIKQQQSAQSTSQATIKTEIETIKDLQAESREDIKAILRNLRSQ